MTVVGGNLERKEIGLSIGVSGTHDKTKINKDTGFLELVDIDVDGEGRPVYTEKGSWTSDVIDLGDIFQDFEKVFTDSKVNGASSFAVLTRVSDNGRDWSDWVAIAEDGTIQSETKQHIQVRIDLFAGFVTDVFLISEFNNVDDVSLFEPNHFVETSNGLRLKREYEYDMTLDSTWSDTGGLHRKKITRDEWVSIDKLKVVSKQ